MKRTIYLPAIERTVTLAQYVAAIRMAKQHPDSEFKHGLTTWWPTKGSDIVRQFVADMNERINSQVPYLRAWHGKPILDATEDFA